MSYSIAIGTYVEARNKVQLSLLYMLNVYVSVIEFEWRKMSQNYPNFAVDFLSMNIEMEKNRPYFFILYGILLETVTCSCMVQ